MYCRLVVEDLQNHAQHIVEFQLAIEGLGKKITFKNHTGRIPEVIPAIVESESTSEEEEEEEQSETAFEVEFNVAPRSTLENETTESSVSEFQLSSEIIKAQGI